MQGAEPFWKTTPMAAMDDAQWESLCDGCGRCCLQKLRDIDTDALAFTNVACRLLNTDTCRCSDYKNRQAEVPDCVRLTPGVLSSVDWLPPSCGYRLVAEGKDLPDWHPLVSGDPASVHLARASVRGRAVPEDSAGDWEDHVVNWPAQMPKWRRKSRR